MIVIPVDPTRLLFQQILDRLGTAIFVLNPDHVIVLANEAFHQAIKTRDGAVVGSKLWDLFDPEKYSHLKEAYDKAFATRENSMVEFESREFGTFSDLRLIFWDDHLIVEIIDTTRLKRTQHELFEQLKAGNDLLLKMQESNSEVTESAHTDSLTGITNRRRGQEIASTIFRGMKLLGQPMSIILLDVDHFKQFNDVYGHAEGDNVLQLVAQSLSKVCSATETAVRFGGEEFIIICPSVGLIEACKRAEFFAETIRGISSASEKVTASFGVASLTELDQDWTTVMERADKAMYTAKQRGRNRVEAWTEDISKSEELRRAS